MKHSVAEFAKKFFKPPELGKSEQVAHNIIEELGKPKLLPGELDKMVEIKKQSGVSLIKQLAMLKLDQNNKSRQMGNSGKVMVVDTTGTHVKINKVSSHQIQHMGSGSSIMWDDYPLDSEPEEQQAIVPFNMTDEEKEKIRNLQKVMQPK